MGRKLTIGTKILKLFETRKELKVFEICDMLPDYDETQIKSAVNRLRGDNGKRPKYLKAVRYLQQAGHGGAAMPILTLGCGADAPKEQGYISSNDELIKRAAVLRAKRQEHQFAKELASLNSYD
jgi:hypothetical protein